MYWLLIGYTQMIPTQYMKKWLGTVRQPFDKQPIVAGLVTHSNDNYSNGLGLDSHSEGNQPNEFCLGQDPYSLQMKYYVYQLCHA